MIFTVGDVVRYDYDNNYLGKYEIIRNINHIQNNVQTSTEKWELSEQFIVISTSFRKRSP